MGILGSDWRVTAPVGLHEVMADIEADEIRADKRYRERRALQDAADAYEAQVSHQVRIDQLRRRLASIGKPYNPFEPIEPAPFP